jgi:hypothetical protein
LFEIQAIKVEVLDPSPVPTSGNFLMRKFA